MRGLLTTLHVNPERKLILIIHVVLLAPTFGEMLLFNLKGFAIDWGKNTHTCVCVCVCECVI